MRNVQQFYINGQWVAPAAGSHAPQMDLVCPATELTMGKLVMGDTSDVDSAVAAAKAAFPAWSRSTRDERLALLERIRALYQARLEDTAQAISSEMGAPIWLARDKQATLGLQAISEVAASLRNFQFDTQVGTALVEYVPIGVVGLITAWNWPAGLIWVKVATALAAGCTIVLKPSEYSPLDAQIAAEILHDAGVPPGVFNMIFGDGPNVGDALSRHPDVSMISITGSGRAGKEVAIAGAQSFKRVVQELGGKSPAIVLDDADLKAAVAGTAISVFVNSGQTCVAPTRLLVPRAQYDTALAIAAATAQAMTVGDPQDPNSKVGPVANRGQFERIQSMIQTGLEDGARIVAGGPGRPESLSQGFYVRPTVFADVSNDMRIAREEIFGPVLVVIPYDSDDEAVAIANDSDYGLAGYVWSSNPDRALSVARQLRTGSVRINGAAADMQAPFGGFKASGNGRELGQHGIAEFMELRSISR